MSQLKTLTVRGFKSIQELNEFRFRNLNLLIGANGAGKSNFISLFRMLGENLAGLTRERELLLDAGTYGRRSTASACLPGALVEDFVLTL